MANFTITIPNNKVNDVVNAFCAKYGWTENSSLPKAQFAKKMIIDFIKNTYVEQESKSFDKKKKQLQKDASDHMADVEIS